MYTYGGNIHVHSVYSDGTGTVPEIAEEAQKKDIRFVIITDHQDIKALEEEGMYGRVLVIAGTELHREANHYLALDIKERVEENSADPQEAIDNVNRQGGFGFLAHPFEKGSPYITEGSAFPWNRLQVKGYCGIELWNFCSQWKSKSDSRLKMLYWYFLNRDGPVKSGAPPECLRFWDYENQKRRVVAIGGTDAHAVNYRLCLFKTVIFPYAYLFGTINTYVLLKEKLSKEARTARRQVVDALREGRCYISLDSIKPGNGFYFGAYNQNTEVCMGSYLDFDDATYLRINSPRSRSVIRIIKNGSLVQESRGKSLLFRVLKPGTFRVELYHRPLVGKAKPWIYSNPVYIK